MRAVRWMSLLVVLCLPLPGARAQQEYFQAELILFQHLFRRADGELLRTGTEELDLNAIDLYAPSLTQTGGGATPPAPDGYALLPAGEHLLQGVWVALGRSAEYRPLLHLAWQQPARRSARPVLLRGAVPCPAQTDRPLLQGTVRLQGRNQPSVKLELDYRPCTQSEPGAAPAPLVRLIQQQRIRPGRLYYLDHPLLGVLLKISRPNTAG